MQKEKHEERQLWAAAPGIFQQPSTVRIVGYWDGVGFPPLLNTMAGSLPTGWAMLCACKNNALPPL